MAERPGDHGGLTSGDPLRGDAPEAPRTPDAPPAARPWAAAPDTAPAATPWATPEAPPPGPSGSRVAGYGPGSPVPPGAGGMAPAWPAPGGPMAAAGRYTLAGWWRRAGATIIDGIIILAVVTLLLVPLGLGVFAVDGDAGAVALVGAFLLTVLVIAAVSLLYAPLMLWKTDGKTIGRMATGIRVVRADGRPMSLGTAVVREVVLKALVFGAAGSFTFGIANLIDYLWPLWDEEHRALHDFPVNTRTILG